MVYNSVKNKRYKDGVIQKTLMYEAMNEECPTTIHKITADEQLEFERKLKKGSGIYVFNPLFNNA